MDGESKNRYDCFPPDLVDDGVPGYALYRGSVPFDKLPWPDDPDNQWAVNDPELRRQYGGQIVAVKDRTLWGVGSTYEEIGRAHV